MIAEVDGDFSEQSVRDYGGNGEVEGAAGFRHSDFEAEAKVLFLGRHKALDLQEPLACAEIEFERDRLPGSLQFAAHDADNAFENLFFDLGNFAGIFAPLAFPAKHEVDNGEGNFQIEFEYCRCASRGEIDGCEVGLFRHALEKLAEGEVLGGNQAAIEDDAQVTADGGCEIAGKEFVKLIDGA